MISLASSSSNSGNKPETSAQKTSAQKTANTSQPARLQQFGATLSKNIWLPDSPTAFAFFLLVIAILCGGLFLHINLSAQIAQAQVDIKELETRYHEIERENAEIVSQIAIATSMFDIHGRATALGYIPLTERDKDFVVASEIQIPQPRVVKAQQQTLPESMTVAEAFAATSQSTHSGTTDQSAEVVPFSGSGNGALLRLDEQVATNQNSADTFGGWLAGWWTED